MTETVKAAPDESNTDTPHPSPSSKTAKPVNQASDGNERPKQIEKAEKPPTKVVVRRLPPTMTLEAFVEQVSPLPPVDFMHFVKADSSLAPHSFCRAYLHFVHVDDMLIFTEKFDNYVFVDVKGNEFPAVVEYAPFQRIPKQRSRRRDPRVGTIENDQYYQEFLEALKAEEAQRKSAPNSNKQHFFETSTSPSVQKVTTTPLLEFLKNRRAAKLRSREERLAERRKREAERRRAQDEVRISAKQVKSVHGDGDAAVTSPSTQVKIAAPGVGSEKNQRDATDNKRTFKVASTSTRQERERDRKEKDREQRRDTHKEQKKETHEKEQGSEFTKDLESGLEKGKDSSSFSTEARSRDVLRKVGKSYQEERQRLNERRQVTKISVSRAAQGEDKTLKNDKEDHALGEEPSNKKMSKRDGETSSDSRGRLHDKYKSSEITRHNSSREPRRPEKFNKVPNKDQDQKRGFESKKNVDHFGEKKEVKKGLVHDDKHAEGPKSGSENNPNRDSKSDQNSKFVPPKDDVRKKSYNQEREQRRAADRKVTSRKDKSDDKTSELTKSDGSLVESQVIYEVSKSTDSPQISVQLKGGGDGARRSSLDGSNTNRQEIAQDEPSRSKSLADIGAGSSHDKGSSSSKSDSNSKTDEREKRDPRAERRIRNKDRPSIEIYRPGMGRFSRQRLEREKGLSKGSSTERDSPSSSPSPIPNAVKSTVI